MNKKQKQSSTTPAQTEGGRPPGTVVAAAGIAVLQSIAVIIFGIFLVVRELTGAENDSMVSDSGAAGFVGLGTAIFVFIVFGFVILASWAFVKGKRWGRGAIVLVEFILGAIAFQMFSGGSAALGAVTLASAALVLYLLMVRPEAAQWAESHF